MSPVSRRPRRTVPVLLAAAVIVPLAAIVSLAVYVFRQDREIEVERRRDTLRGAAARLALALEGQSASVEDQLAEINTARFIRDELRPGSLGALLYRPDLKTSDRSPDDIFAEADALEFQHRDASAAASAYASLAQSREPDIQAAALVRLGALRRNQQETSAALAIYDTLQQLGSVTVDGQPADLIARQARCHVFQATNDASRLRRESADLERVLYAGHFAIDRPTFLFYVDLLKSWGGSAPSEADVARTEATVDLWRTWRSGALPARGRRILKTEASFVLATWATAQDETAIRIDLPAAIADMIDRLATPHNLITSIVDVDGSPLLGPTGIADAVTLMPGETRLPFVLRVAFTPGPFVDGAAAGRQLALLIGLTLAITVVLAAAFGLARATAREMTLVRQQQDFVSAISHEFRTPLTSMRHLTELLATNSVQGEERKATYYGLLSRETERLHRMVESLLSYSRIQAGAYAWRLQETSLVDLVREVINQFREEQRAAGRQITFTGGGDVPMTEVDRDAIARAVLNLLENAVKYSDPQTPIDVGLQRSGGAIEIAVTDHGVGIPVAEQRGLFDRFVRGSQAKRAGIGGIGIGLALVKSVAGAHGGSVRVVSQVGQGSVFTLSLPIVNAQDAVGFRSGRHRTRVDAGVSSWRG
jgi:signal transduction histidine kinase